MKILVFLCLVLFGLTAKSQEIKLDSLVYDFGKIKVSTENHKVKVYFTNVGKKPLIIESIQWGVSDMVALKPTEPIYPDKKSYFEITFMTNRIGKQNRYFNINTNSVNGKSAVFRIKYEIIE
ncbi:DUF1573 domain-containing protein [Flavobacterium terrisoli]|uniref:DUF1573 domain-containing protein n=1 Tax=Flavobacterium terrisoli TaxID=3242195 RepID=UPI00254285EF|nr:DUF1573 domain-containing protein [Flavobacterium buctense]